MIICVQRPTSRTSEALAGALSVAPHMSRLRVRGGEAALAAGDLHQARYTEPELNKTMRAVLASWLLFALERLLGGSDCCWYALMQNSCE